MDQRFSLLVVEDNPADAEFIREMLSEIPSASFDLDCVDTLAAAREHLAHRRPDAILLDLSLPDSSGLVTFSELHAHSSHVPTIIVTGMADEQLALEAVSAGAQDYVLKSEMQPESLFRCIRYGIERHKRALKSRMSTGSRPKRPPKILGFMGVKGGTGTSTVALGVATLLVREFDVIAAELHPFFSSFARQLDIVDTPGTAEAALAECLWTLPSGLRLLLGHPEIRNFQRMPAEMAESIIRELAAITDYLILDLPPSAEDANRAALRCCDSVVLVIDRDPISVVAANQVVGMLLGENISKNVISAIIVERSLAAIPIPLSEIKAQVACPITAVLPPAPHLCAAATRACVPPAEMEPGSELGQALESVAQQFGLSSEFADLADLTA